MDSLPPLELESNFHCYGYRGHVLKAAMVIRLRDGSIIFVKVSGRAVTLAATNAEKKTKRHTFSNAAPAASTVMVLNIMAKSSEIVVTVNGVSSALALEHPIGKPVLQSVIILGDSKYTIINLKHVLYHPLVAQHLGKDFVKPKPDRPQDPNSPIFRSCSGINPGPPRPKKSAVALF